MNLEIKEIGNRLIVTERDTNETSSFETYNEVLEYMKLYFERIEYNRFLKEEAERKLRENATHTPFEVWVKNHRVK